MTRVELRSISARAALHSIARAPTNARADAERGVAQGSCEVAHANERH
jgi:hypothetical protein